VRHLEHRLSEHASQSGVRACNDLVQQGRGAHERPSLRCHADRRKGTPERKRADEIYNFVIVPALKQFDILPYRADLDPSPGAITQKMLSELVEASLVIADLTGRNPNVFYELGIAHSFGKPLISIADAVSSLPFDAKDERVIELGEYSAAGLTYAQGESAKASLVESLGVVLDDGYLPPSP